MWRARRPLGRATGAVEAEEDGTSGDARLVAGLRRRTPAAFAGLHEQYAAHIYNLALRMVGQVADAEDITQDVLIRAYERLPRDREVLLRPWLYRLTLNRCYDHLRAAARRRPAHRAAGGAGRARGRDGHGAAEPELASPHDPFEQSELNRLFEAALADLTRRQRAALLLKDVHGLSLAEVAACLELTPGSVEVLLARARKTFRTSFEGRCLAEDRPAPSAARALAALPALPLFPLPRSLVAPPLPAIVAPLPVGAAPIAAAAGGGIGAALGLPATFKTAALIIAAAATVGTAEVAATHGDGARPHRAAPAAVAEAGAPVARAASAHGGSAPRRQPSAAGHPASPASSPAPTSVASPVPTATPTETVATAASPTPLGIPSLSPSPDVAPSPDVTPTASPTPQATDSPSPSPSASPSPSPSP